MIRPFGARAAASVLFLAAGWFPLVTGCEDDPAGPGGEVGSGVESVTPGPQALGVDRRAGIEIRLTEAADPSTVAAARPVVSGRWSGTAGGSWLLSPDGRTLRFDPDRPFFAGEWVTVVLPGAIGGGYAWGFWTRAGAGSLDVSLTTVQSLRLEGEGAIRSYGAHAGDANGDGWSDLMVPNEDVNDIRILLNDGAGDYPSIARYPVPAGDNPSTNEGVDLDRDGDLDFLIGNARNDVVAVFLNDGAGLLTHRSNHLTDQQVRGLCTADLDLDGFVDVVTANRTGGGGGNVSVLLGDGSGGLGPPSTFDTGTEGETACAVGDANGDGATDVFIGALVSQEIVVLLGDGQGRLAVGERTAAGGRSWMLAAGDLNGDGRVDVVSANSAQDNVGVLLGDGTGRLRLDAVYPVGRNPLAVDLGDMDGDGDLDVVTSNFGGIDWTVYENLGDGRLAAPRSYPAHGAGSCAILHDRDNDGDLDLTGIDELSDELFLFTNGG